MKRRLFVLLLFALTANAAHAADTPAPGANDKRLRSVVYNKDEVFSIRMQLGIATYFLFADGEKHEAWYSGDPEAFVVGEHDNLLTFKPRANDIDTNLIIRTNKRVYNMHVVTKAAGGFFGVRFEYPDDVAKAKADEKAIAERDKKLASATDPYQQTSTNVAYIGSGSVGIMPDIVFDNSTHTFFHFPEAIEWPAIYRGTGDAESLTQSTTKDNWLIVPRVDSSWTLRLGDSVVCIRNLHSSALTRANRTNTAAPFVKRTDKPAGEGEL